MDWDAVIEVISDTIKDDTVRSDIYKKLFDLVGVDGAQDSEGQDDVFDSVLEGYIYDDEDDIVYNDEDDGFDYGDDD